MALPLQVHGRQSGGHRPGRSCSFSALRLADVVWGSMSGMTIRVAAALVGVCLLAPAGAVTRAAAKRPITELDLMKFTWVADPQISRLAERIAFVRVTVNEKDNKYESSIYMIAGTSGESAARPLTSGKHDLSPRWSPDDKWLAFVRPDDKDTP